MEVDVGFVVGIAEITMEELVQEAQLDVGCEKGRVDVEAYLCSDIDGGRWVLYMLTRNSGDFVGSWGVSCPVIVVYVRGQIGGTVFEKLKKDLAKVLW